MYLVVNIDVRECSEEIKLSIFLLIVSSKILREAAKKVPLRKKNFLEAKKELSLS